ncbi:unnamed protein product [Medioppia subpectinata]|uniref:Carboxylesterase type B domain-containing protein n=1 Tax=Medioppia subpectinata TaxID=1979941 RepID=A0A7R9KUP1_9ACAR|nr:unnamed protein product [Medioppia subpectinata]CAG2110215.1 unnamed protein product [Medioppia subpectinata]
MSMCYYKIVKIFILYLTLNTVNSIDVNTSIGVVRGRTLHVLDTNVNQFLGIPYAEPPVGKHRFAKPKPITKPFPDIIDATKLKNSCIQPPNIYITPELHYSEDCLVLNIWTTNTTALKPVMFWIYGGGLTMGSIFQEWYNGSALATNDVVVVSVNYRLGPFGFLYGDREDAPGNVGLYDQLLGLKWVRENIHLFGGDRNQITIFGESAGSWSVSAHILSPLSKGLFKRAIMESGALMFNKNRNVVNKTEAILKGKNIAKQLKCDESEDWIQCLRKADARNIVKYETTMFTSPVLDTEFLPLSARQAFNEKKFNTDIDLIAGITRNEGIGYADYLTAHPERMTLTDFHNGVKAMDSLGFHNINIPKVTEHYLKGVKLLYEYYELLYASNYFGKQMACDVPTMGICHGNDVPFVFGLPLLKPNDYTPDDIYYSTVLMKMWTIFAKDGQMDSNWPQLLNDEPMGAPKVHGLDPKDLRLVLKDPVHSIDVDTRIGVVRGQTLHVLDTNVDQFVGIPYAEPPVGKHRFAKPEPISKPFPNIIDATMPKNSCLSPIQLSPDSPLSENCLVLNIWTTNTTALKPVMFWIYGGGLAAGSIYQPEYNGSALATNDVVVVSVNYRLGPFGFLYGDREDAPGNVGFYDQLLGLKWARRNIHSFGGDRDQITIFGESAGSWSVSAHILSPLSKGLYKRAIMESAAFMFNIDKDVVNKTEAISQGKAMAKQLKCNETEDWIKCLRRADANDILKYWDPFATYPVFGTEFLPIRTQQAFNEKKFNTDVDLIAGIVRNEGSALTGSAIKDPDHMTIADFYNGMKAFDALGYHNLNVTKVADHYLKGVNTSSPAALLQSFSSLAGDLTIGCPTYLFAKRFAQTVKESQRVYFYELLYASKWFANYSGCDISTMGICHGMDIVFVFGLPLLYSNVSTPEDIYYSKVVMKIHMDSYWPQLLNNDPTGAPKVHGLDPKDLRLVLSDPFHQTCDGVWADYFL